MTHSIVLQVENISDSIHRKTAILLAAFEGSHPLVPKRKQSAYELERGPIYPETEADKWTCILHVGTKSQLRQQGSKTSSPQQVMENAVDGGIRTDPSLEVFFTAGQSDAQKDARPQPFQRKKLDALNPT
jgi:hypothetical protein